MNDAAEHDELEGEKGDDGGGGHEDRPQVRLLDVLKL